ncbi:MAG: diguanylate cyclase [Azoarcus sp.]|jgi:diguanylate cyclase|nr:diguanylate cyclase [Azoarcus sp.]
MSAAPKNPTDIARETIRMLAVRRIPPTPDNYREIYAKVAGTPPAESFPEKAMKQLAAEIGRAAALPSMEHALSQAIAEKNWTQLAKALSAPLTDLTHLQQMAWGALIRDLFRQWENTASQLMLTQKREALEHVLQSAASNPATLFARLESLQKSWSQTRHSGSVEMFPADFSDEPADQAISREAPDGMAEAEALVLLLRELFVYALENCHASLNDDDLLAEECHALIEAAHSASTPKQFQAMRQKLKDFAFRLELLDEDHRELSASLQKLLRLVVENVGELVLDDQWIHGQIEVVRDILGQPLSQKNLDDAELRFKEVVFKQSQLKLGLQDAQNAMKSMLADFVEHLKDFTGATSDYHAKIKAISGRISHVERLSDLESVLEEVMQETIAIQASARQSSDNMLAMQSQVRQAETRIHELERELARASELVRYDQLTGTLNRRGLEEIFEKEIKRSERRHAPVCLALLDIDNFKQLNDSLGHTVGDDALVHLVKVARETLRPQDSVARFGGEEFIILFPETSLEQAAVAVTRIQRELTRHIFLYQNQKLLITFSAGLALYVPGEDQDALIRRADAAMYEAKQSGKNRVVTAVAPNADGADLEG